MADPMDDRVVRGLIVCPAGDVNYKHSLLPHATTEQLNVALSVLRVRDLPGTKSRQIAIVRELRRREKVARKPVHPSAPSAT